MKKLFSSYAFWVAFASAIAIFLEDFSNLVGLNINTSLIESLIMSFCGVLIVLGIVKKKEIVENNEEIEVDFDVNNEEIEKNLLEEVEKQDKTE